MDTNLENSNESVKVNIPLLVVFTTVGIVGSIVSAGVVETGAENVETGVEVVETGTEVGETVDVEDVRIADDVVTFDMTEVIGDATVVSA